MQTTQPTYALTPPALDAFGGPHFADEDDPRAGGPLAWVGDQSSVPLPAEASDDQRLDADGAELDRAIFAALVTP